MVNHIFISVNFFFLNNFFYQHLDGKCCKCDGKSLYFCRNQDCLDYYCQHCWTYCHFDDKDNIAQHEPMKRQNKPNYG